MVKFWAKIRLKWGLKDGFSLHLENDQMNFNYRQFHLKGKKF